MYTLAGLTRGVLSCEKQIEEAADQSDKRHARARHTVFNLTNPDQSLILTAPLAKSAGGLELCRRKDEDNDSTDKKGHPKLVDSRNDEDYQTMLAHIVAGKDYLEDELTRFDMPHFRPRREYFRELKRYGILPPEFNPDTDPFDVYALDRKYWESLWYSPDGE